MSKKKPFLEKRKLLGSFSVIMITIGSVDSIRNLPTMALFGSSLFFFFAAAVVFFLLPSTLIITELAATWPVAGGIYTWVKKAFGKRVGFMAIWFQWIENIIWYPTILSFAAATIGYLISPTLADNKIFLISVIIATFWGITIINLMGLRLSVILANVCTISGLLLPMIIIIGLGMSWLFAGKPLQIDLSLSHLLPNFSDPKIWVALTGIIMSFCGTEIATIHAEDVRTPHKAFPLALTISAIVLVVTLAFGALSVAIVLPEQQISLVAGIMQTFQAFLAHHNLHWTMPFIALILIIGSVGGVNNWVIAPIKGLFAAARDGHLPKHLTRSNKKEAPHFILLYQAAVVTLLMTIFLFEPSINGSYWLLTVLAAQVYMLVYLLLFASAIRLRFKRPDKHRPFRVPGKNFGMVITGTTGIIGALTTFAIGFIPPENIQIGSVARYETILITGLFLLVLCPFIIYRLRYNALLEAELNDELK